MNKIGDFYRLPCSENVNSFSCCYSIAKQIVDWNGHIAFEGTTLFIL